MKVPRSMLCCLLALHPLSASVAGDHYGSHGKRGYASPEFKEEFWDGPCTVKIESKPGEFKREIKCKDGHGAHWRGSWKREYRDGYCYIKEDVKVDEFKEEVKCESGR